MTLTNCFAVPFVVTIVVSFLFTCYMLFDPSVWLSDFMQLTFLSWDFKVFILVLGTGFLAISWSMEKYGLPRLAKWIGMAKERLSKTPKQRKAYKLILEKMRI